MRIVFLPHAQQQMVERGIPEDLARSTLEEPHAEYPGDMGRTVAERTFEGARSAVKVVYNMGAGEERVVVSVMRGRAKFPNAARGGER